MTAAKFRAECDSDIRALSVAIATCVCNADVEPELRRVRSFDSLHSVECQACRRGVYGPTKADAVQMWNAMLRVAATLTKALRSDPYVVRTVGPTGFTRYLGANERGHVVETEDSERAEHYADPDEAEAAAVRYRERCHGQTVHIDVANVDDPEWRYVDWEWAQ